MGKLIKYIDGQKLIDSGFKGTILTMRIVNSKEFGISVMQPISLNGGWITSSDYKRILEEDFNASLYEIWDNLVKDKFEVYDFFDDKVIHFDYVK